MKTENQFKELFQELLKAGLINEFERQGREFMREQEKYPNPIRQGIIQTWMDQAEKHGYFQLLTE